VREQTLAPVDGAGAPRSLSGMAKEILGVGDPRRQMLRLTQPSAS
jgi:hypothetical protein